MITVTGTLKDIFGVADQNAQVIFQLCGFGSQMPRVSGSALLAKGSNTITVPNTGIFSQQLFGNDVIVPAGTFYTLTLLDDAGNVIATAAYQFIGSGSVDISTLTPVAPPAVWPLGANPVLLNPSGPQTIAGYGLTVPALTVAGSITIAGFLQNHNLVAVSFAATLALNAALGSVFDVTLTGNVTSSTLANVVPGQVYVFIVAQDATGGRTFTWPTNVLGGEAPDTTASRVSVQAFITRASGNLYPIAPMMSY